MEISIGKFTLESLTTGMYSEPESCFREYIQNAVDSLDSAINQGIINLDASRIEIIVDSNRQELSVKDNGTGINVEKASKTLLDIGNSTKTHASNRGLDVDELEYMDEDERREALEDAGLDPADYDDF